MAASTAPTTTNNITFLTLPVELRRQIYNLLLPTSRLTPFPLIDPEWSMNPPDPSQSRGIPKFLFTSHQIYSEATPTFYSRAILEVAPPPQSTSFWDFSVINDKSNGKGGGRKITHAYARLIHTFRIYRPEHLRLIRRAHIYSNQTQAVNGQCYEALLTWLVEFTAVDRIDISGRPMTRIRGEAGFDLGLWKRVFLDKDSSNNNGPITEIEAKVHADTDTTTGTNINTAVPRQNLRIIRIWTQKPRPPWEYEKMLRLRCKATDGTLNPMQIYFYVSDDKDSGRVELMLDPRWLIRSTEDERERIEELEVAAPLIDRVVLRVLEGKEARDYRDGSRHVAVGRGGEWVYQMILVPVLVSVPV